MSWSIQACAKDRGQSYQVNWYGKWCDTWILVGFVQRFLLKTPSYLRGFWHKTRFSFLSYTQYKTKRHTQSHAQYLSFWLCRRLSANSFRLCFQNDALGAFDAFRIDVWSLEKRQGAVTLVDPGQHGICSFRRRLRTFLFKADSFRSFSDSHWNSDTHWHVSVWWSDPFAPLVPQTAGKKFTTPNVDSEWQVSFPVLWTRSSAHGNCSAKSLAGNVVDSSLSSLFSTSHANTNPQIHRGSMGGLGRRGPGGGRGKGAGDISPPYHIYCTTTWCLPRRDFAQWWNSTVNFIPR